MFPQLLLLFCFSGNFSPLVLRTESPSSSSSLLLINVATAFGVGLAAVAAALQVGQERDKQRFATDNFVTSSSCSSLQKNIRQIIFRLLQIYSRAQLKSQVNLAQYILSLLTNYVESFRNVIFFKVSFVFFKSRRRPLLTSLSTSAPPLSCGGWRRGRWPGSGSRRGPSSRYSTKDCGQIQRNFLLQEKRAKISFCSFSSRAFLKRVRL